MENSTNILNSTAQKIFITHLAVYRISTNVEYLPISLHWNIPINPHSITYSRDMKWRPKNLYICQTLTSIVECSIELRLCMISNSSAKVAWNIKHAIRSANSLIFDKPRRNLKKSIFLLTEIPTLQHIEDTFLNLHKSVQQYLIQTSTVCSHPWHL